MMDLLRTLLRDGPEGPGEAAGRAMAALWAGGPVVLLLAGLSVLALTIVLAKAWQYLATGLGDRHRAREAVRLWRAGDPDAALSRAGRSRNPAARAVARAIRGTVRGLPENRVREEVMRRAAEEIESLRGWLRPLEVIASLAPLLGLFGTVLGMIEAFRQLEAAGSRVDPAILSGGIWEALLTTAVGLAVAIPTVAALNWLERVVERVAHEVEVTTSAVFTEDLSGDGRAGVPDDAVPVRDPVAAGA